ncbi:tetraacyldisaccharide 4'-kinase [Pseudooceanicola sp.]|uniref:tetraacyldisaccharide 4'-kinase n=1 Tax=Pseudooceanicola sp. TaxID=1914328 RepID=UPI00260297E2|nr:tetraacyldisaccharide 4'-kinase [Pseudooceanicola sp.]MDF1856056.1 tetraacyldisaccharide 4'-kinase [Pseudooceanicola sp.]
MRSPDFWHRPTGALARILTPLGWAYGAATGRRIARHGPGVDPGVPVICVGNLNAGGTGKTPTVIALLQMLAERGIAAHVLTRGYGGTAAGPLRVDERRDTAARVGDEALLLSAFAPVWVARDRLAGARAAVAAGAALLILDDGFQDPALMKSLALVVVDAARGFGNGHCLPAGPLREPIASGLARADLLISVGAARAQAGFTALWGRGITVPQVMAELCPLPTGMDWTGTPFLAFAGIGHPEKFFATLRRLGATLIHAEALADHQPLSAALMMRLERDAARHGAQLVTTEKDAVRLPPEWRQRVITLPVRLAFQDPAPLLQALERIGQRVGPAPAP